MKVIQCEQGLCWSPRSSEAGRSKVEARGPAGGSPGALASLGEAAPSLKDNSLEGTQL